MNEAYDVPAVSRSQRGHQVLPLETPCEEEWRRYDELGSVEVHSMGDGCEERRGT